MSSTLFFVSVGGTIGRFLFVFSCSCLEPKLYVLSVVSPFSDGVCMYFDNVLFLPVDPINSDYASGAILYTWYATTELKIHTYE